MSWKSWPRVVVIGDSLTEFGFESNGWTSLLANSLSRKCDVINRGFGGYNTNHMRLVFDDVLKHSVNNSNTAAVTLFLGANDAFLPDKAPKAHVPLEEYRDNLRVLAMRSCHIHLKIKNVTFLYLFIFDAHGL